MSNKQSNRAEAEKLFELIEDFHTGMFTTQGAGGALHSRPMAVAEITPEKNVLLVTSLDSAKVKELSDSPGMSISFQSGSSKIAALSGKAYIEKDRAKLKELWNTNFDAWFENGPESEDAALIRCEIERGEYWDTSGAKALAYVYEVAKASAAGGDPNLPESSHGRADV